jgi:hypothetical protein
MEFIVKDLMISVLPLRGVRLGDVASCGACTSDSTAPGPCGKGSGGPIENWLDYVISPATPAGLAALKQQLREALASVEAREKVVHESMRPTSAAEISILQTHLTAALEDLKTTAASIQGQKALDSPRRS